MLAATGIYGGIARKVEAAGAHAWDHRAHTTKLEKLGWLAHSWAGSLRPAGDECEAEAAKRRHTLADLRDRAARNRVLILAA